MKKSLKISIILNILLVFCASVLVLNKLGMLSMSDILAVIGLGGQYSYLSNPQYNANETMFELYKGEADIVFIGDSYTQFGHFDELLDERGIRSARLHTSSSTSSADVSAVSILNRGIGSDTTEGLYNRIDEIISHKPHKIFILIGANDLGQNVPLETTLHFYQLIIEKIKNSLPDCEIYIQSVPPSKQLKFREKKLAMNKALEQLATEQNCVYIDLFSKFFDGNGNLIEDYISLDNVHFTGKGYAAWVEAVTPYCSATPQNGAKDNKN